MLRGMFTHPLHVMLRGMLTHPLHNSDPEIKNVITMLRGMITHPDSVGYGDDGGADDGADGAEKHLVHLAQVADCCWEEISKSGADDGADGAEKHLVHLAKVADCYWEEISEGGADDDADGAEKHLVHHAQVSNMLRGMITHPLHLTLRGMHNHSL